MAEGANVRQNLQNIPSIFEISAAETLDNLIYPALSRIFDFLGLRVNFKLTDTKRIREELSPVLTWILQYMYLRKRGSSFGESFYGLQRTHTTTGELLSRQQEIISASLLTLLPYIERKLRTRVQNEEASPWEEYALKLFNAYKASKAIHTFMYLIKYAGSHSPIFRALKLTLRYPSQPPKEDKATYIVLKLLEVLAFFLQFIQWWYSNDQRRKIGGTLRNPKAIEETEESVKQCDVPDGDCPICLMKIDNPTACGVSGYVFCWKCIITRLKTHPTCPVTGYAISIDDLIRIYES
ncbi:peroxisome assembly protein 12-like [Haematobia irritans]|uniref:peroxisome assembly protein 12-like n=1 Tax=Haematobia irritans TaxID=7368 RepID=UPI003F4F5434